jgi:hypothetical protein
MEEQRQQDIVNQLRSAKLEEMDPTMRMLLGVEPVGPPNGDPVPAGQTLKTNDAGAENVR